MALSIKTEKADRLARDLAKLTGETMTQAVTIALEQRLERERAARTETEEDLVAQVKRLTAEMRGGAPFRPVSPEEWLEVGGDDLDFQLAAEEQATKAQRR